MVSKNLNKSRLKETNFSSYNLRDAYIADIPEYYSALRDEVIFSNYGVKALVRVPADDNFEMFDNSVDEYSNFVTSHWIDTVECVVPKFLEYRQNVDVYGMSADGTDGLYPLEVAIPSKLHLPRDSRIIFSEYDSNENQIAREWTVLSTQMKQLSNSKTYTRVAMCVPARKETYKPLFIKDINTIWFDVNPIIATKTATIRAQGNIWFDNILPASTSILRVFVKSDIQETPVDNPIFIPVLKECVFYDTRSKTIVDGGFAFEVDENCIVYDSKGEEVYVDIDGKGTMQPLILTVTEVDKIGKLTGYKLNVEKGYTSVGEEGILQVGVENSRGITATINLTAVELTDSVIQETVLPQFELGAKYITPNKLDAVFSSKKIAIAVLD